MPRSRSAPAPPSDAEPAGSDGHQADGALVRLDRVHKVYLTGSVPVRALAGVDLEVRSGEFVAIQGPSGCGKSTLLNLVGGVDTPTQGRVLVGGKNLLQLSDDQLTDFRRDHVGFVFQVHNLIPSLTAEENIGLPLEFAGRSPDRVARRVEEILRLVGLEDRADHTPSLLSGGEQQRVAIGRALANNPDLILLDEPTGDLDRGTTEEILDHLVELNRRGKTLIMVTHDPVVAAPARRRVEMRDGKVLQDVAIKG